MENIIEKTTNNNNDINKTILFQQYIFEVFVEFFDNIVDFIALGNTCQHHRKLMLKSNRWRNINLSKMTQISDSSIFKFSRLLNQYYLKRYQIPFIESLTLDNCYMLTDKAMNYISEAYLMSRIKHLSLAQCQITSIVGLFKGCAPPTQYILDIQQKDIPLEIPRLQSLTIPLLHTSSNIAILKYLSNITYLSLPGSIESFMLLRLLESAPNLKYLTLNGRFENNIFNSIIMDALCKHKDMEELHLFGMSKMNSENIGQMAMNLVNLKKLSVTNNQWLSGDIVNLVIESCPKLTHLDLSFCRNVSNINVYSTSLISVDLSNTGVSPDIYFPSLRSLSIKGWKVDNDITYQIFVRNTSIVNLNISNTSTNDQQIEIILQNIKNLNYLNIENCNITIKSIQEIQKKFPHLPKFVYSQSLTTQK